MYLLFNNFYYDNLIKEKCIFILKEKRGDGIFKSITISNKILLGFPDIEFSFKHPISNKNISYIL